MQAIEGAALVITDEEHFSYFMLTKRSESVDYKILCGLEKKLIAIDLNKNQYFIKIPSNQRKTKI